ncbi:hypothetical protein ILUMI_22373 [Ignelater luminosus]|uniref:Uncharacterized protein n=1 Tax=Ignelater luminosus TaxID=2038154 RepID=A0A8K0CEH5_IGNLU|nr:hypothetical protein ILUMI_22373 [Ignelater luminosus]
MLMEFCYLRRRNKECVQEYDKGSVLKHVVSDNHQRKRKSEYVHEHDQEYKRKRIEKAIIKKKTFMHNNKVNSKRDASAQVSVPPSPKRYLKPNRYECSSNLAYEVVHSSNKNDISNGIKSQRTMMANSISSKQLESYSVKCVHQEVIVNPSASRKPSEVAIQVNMNNSSGMSKTSNGTNNFVEENLRTQSSNIRLKTYEFWI